MPTYDYECRKCGTEFRIDASISEKEKLKPTCTKCKSLDTFQLFRRANLVDSMNTPRPPPQMPPGGGMGGMPGMGMPPGMCGF